MAPRGKLCPLLLAKNAWRMIRHPAIAYRLISQEASKLFFDLINPQAQKGYARPARTSLGAATLRLEGGCMVLF